MTWLAPTGVFALGLGIVARESLRLRREVRASGYRLCQHCYYDLSGREAPNSVCSECGAASQMASIQRYWRSIY